MDFFNGRAQMQGGIQVGFHSEVYNVFEVSQLFPFNSFNSGLF